MKIGLNRIREFSDMSLKALLIEVMAHLEEEYGWVFTEEEYNNTPDRIIAMLEEWDGKHNYDKFTAFPNSFDNQNLVILKDIHYTAVCSHHLMPFSGTVSIAYLPKDKVIGASKLARLVDKYAYQAQIQERMTEEIAEELERVLAPEGIMVYVEGSHSCMTARGVNQANSIFVSSAIRGAFRTNPELKAEALKLIKG